MRSDKKTSTGGDVNVLLLVRVKNLHNEQDRWEERKEKEKENDRSRIWTDAGKPMKKDQLNFFEMRPFSICRRILLWDIRDKQSKSGSPINIHCILYSVRIAASFTILDPTFQNLRVYFWNYDMFINEVVLDLL
jgi:hypothetical protein